MPQMLKIEPCSFFYMESKDSLNEPVVPIHEYKADLICDSPIDKVDKAYCGQGNKRILASIQRHRKKKHEVL